MKVKKPKQKIKEDHLPEILVEMGKDLNVLKLAIEKKDKHLSQYNEILKATKLEYQKLYSKNKELTEENKTNT